MSKFRVKEFRKNNKISIKELSEATGVSVGSITSIESGKTKNPRTETLKALADYFKVDVFDLYSEDSPESKIKKSIDTRSLGRSLLSDKPNKKSSKPNKKSSKLNLSEMVDNMKDPVLQSKLNVKKKSNGDSFGLLQRKPRDYSEYKEEIDFVQVTSEFLVDSNKLKFFIKSFDYNNPNKHLENYVSHDYNGIVNLLYYTEIEISKGDPHRKRFLFKLLDKHLNDLISLHNCLLEFREFMFIYEELDITLLDAVRSISGMYNKVQSVINSLNTFCCVYYSTPCIAFLPNLQVVNLLDDEEVESEKKLLEIYSYLEKNKRTMRKLKHMLNIKSLPPSSQIRSYSYTVKKD